MQVIEDFVRKLQAERLSVLKVSKELDIPAYRIYKWISKKASPKHEDVVKLEKWLAKVPHETIEISQDARINMLVDEVAKIKRKIYGVSLDDALDELEQNAKLLALRQIEKGGS